jgi:hypothetical protein
MRSAWQTLINVLSIISAAVTIFVAIRSWYPEASPDAKPAIQFLILISAGLMIALFATHVTYSRRARYGRIIPSLNEIHSDLFQLVSRGGLSVAAARRATCQQAVDHLSDIFGLVTGRRCAVCVKAIVTEDHESQFRAQTLWRSRNSQDRENPSQRSRHWLDKNTDFEALFAEERRYFFSNWLPGIAAYKNSSFEVYGNPPDGNIPIIGGLIRGARWTLPYRSTIVCAIRPRPTHPSDEDATQDVIGYLCVDSRRSRTFSEDDDVELLQGVAELLYPIIRLMKESGRR